MTKLAYDIRTKDKEYHTKLEKRFDVKMMEEDEALHYDNCYREYKATCISNVSKSSQKQKKHEMSFENKILIEKEKMIKARRLELEEKRFQYKESLSSNEEDMVPGQRIFVFR